MTLTQIEIFVELSKEKNFSRTAENLGITQSAVSHAIKKLEQELEVHLLSRERKNLKLTEIGENLLIYCTEIQQQVKNIESEVSSQKNGTKGSVRLGTVWSIANTILPKLLNAHKRKYPTVDVSVFEGTDQEIEEWLCHGVVDIGILHSSNEHLDLVQLTEDQFHVAVSTKHPLAKKKILEYKELEPYPFILSKAGCEPLISAIAQLYNVKFNIKYEAREIFTIANMVKENLGISIIPELARPKNISGIKYIPLNSNYKRKIYLATLKKCRRCCHLANFIDQLLATKF